MRSILVIAIFYSSFLEAKSNSVQTNEVSAEIKVQKIEPDDYHYGLTLERGPFNIPTEFIKKNTLDISITNETQRYRVNDLKLVGLWGLEGESPHALIEMPDMKSEVLQPGDYMGNAGAKVVKITEDFIRVRKITVLPDGTKNFEDQEIGFTKKPTKKEDTLHLSLEVPSRSANLNAKESINTTINSPASSNLHANPEIKDASQKLDSEALIQKTSDQTEQRK